MSDTDTRDDLSDWITTAQAAQMLDLTPRRIRQLIDDGKLHGQLINPRLYLVSRTSVEAYRQERES